MKPKFSTSKTVKLANKLFDKMDKYLIKKDLWKKLLKGKENLYK